MSIQVLEFIWAEPHSAMDTLIGDDREKHWMYKLKTLAPFGLNDTDGSNQTRSRPNRTRQVQP